jgi:hypothetical protein
MACETVSGTGQKGRYETKNKEDRFHGAHYSIENQPAGNRLL